MTKINESEKKPAVAKQKRIILISVCAFLALVLMLGIVLGAMAQSKKARTFVSFGGVWIDGEVASFFASQFKTQFMAALSASGISGVEDSPGFWNKLSDDGKTYLELMNEGVREYVSQILCANYLFDRYTSLSKESKKAISDAAEATLEYKADGSVEKFNELSAEYGFSYTAYKTACKMLYKALYAEQVVCGAGGENLKDEDGLVAEYLAKYTHVKLLFIRTETAYTLDTSGNRVSGSDGKYVTHKLTDEEKAERAALIAEIRSYIDAIGTDEASMGAEMFDSYLENDDEGAKTSHTFGYYLHKDSAYGKAFSEAFSEVTDKAYSMKVGEFSEARFEDGVCFIYKYETTPSDVERDALEEFFRDFYPNMSKSFFSEQISSLSKDVRFDERFNDLDMILLPYNTVFVPRF